MVRYSEIMTGTKKQLVRCDYHEHTSEGEKERCKESSLEPESEDESGSDDNGESGDRDTGDDSE